MLKSPVLETRQPWPWHGACSSESGTASGRRPSSSMTACTTAGSIVSSGMTCRESKCVAVAFWRKCDSVADGRGASTETAVARTVTARRGWSVDAGVAEAAKRPAGDHCEAGLPARSGARSTELVSPRPAVRLARSRQRSVSAACEARGSRPRRESSEVRASRTRRHSCSRRLRPQ